MSMQKFNSLSSTQTDLDKFLIIFQVNFRIFLRKFQKFPILKKKSKKSILKHIFYQNPSIIFTKISKLILIFFTSEFALEISKFWVWGASI
jgi:hypothetical protein